MVRGNRKVRNTASSYAFTNVEDLKYRFFNNAENRRKAGDKADGDAGYWQGGRCNWGGSHNLDEDCEELAKFFNGIANIGEDINQIKLSANEQIFNTNKQQLVSKLQSLVSKCCVTSSTSVAGICIIWDDYFGSYLKPFLNTFSAQLTRQLKEVEKLEPKHQKELLDLESQARAAESAYKENLQKANDETDPTKKAEFIVLANNAAREAEKIKQKIKTNPLMEASNFNYLDDLKKLAKGNVPKPNKKTPKGNASSVSNSNENFFSKYRKEIFVAVVGLGIMLYIYSQDDNISTRE